MPNPTALDMGEMFGISQECMTEIGKGLDDMMQLPKEQPTLIFASDVFRYIEGICNTNEELIWAITNHTLWMAYTGRMMPIGTEWQAQIEKYGEPKNLPVK